MIASSLHAADKGVTVVRNEASNRVDVLVDAPGVGRSHREAPEIDGVVFVDAAIAPGATASVEVVDAVGCDLVAAGADPVVAGLDDV
jgi:hypothetical protein